MMRLNDRGHPLDELVDAGHAATMLPGHRAGRPGQMPVHHASAAEQAQRRRTAKQASNLAQQLNRKYDPRPGVNGSEILAAYGITTGDLYQLHGLTVDSAWDEVQRHRRSGSTAHRQPERLGAAALAHVIGRTPRTLRRWLKAGLIPDATGPDGTWSQAFASGLAAIISDLGLGDSRITARQRDQLRLRAHRLRDDLAAVNEL